MLANKPVSRRTVPALLAVAVLALVPATSADACHKPTTTTTTTTTTTVAPTPTPTVTTEVPATTPVGTTPVETTPVETTPVETTPVETTPADDVVVTVPNFTG